MDKALIERIFQECGFPFGYPLPSPEWAMEHGGAVANAHLNEAVERFATLIAEECAKVAEEDVNYTGEDGEPDYAAGSQSAADRIRAKFGKGTGHQP